MLAQMLAQVFSAAILKSGGYIGLGILLPSIIVMLLVSVFYMIADLFSRFTN